MSAPTAGPLCPRCRRKLAAWKMDHCVYCGESFPADLKAGFEAPPGLQWAERPALPTDVSKKLEMMKVVPAQGPKKSKNLLAIAGLISIPIFAALFYLTYRLVSQLSPTTSLLILVAGAGVVAYLVWIFRRART